MSAPPHRGLPPPAAMPFPQPPSSHTSAPHPAASHPPAPHPPAPHPPAQLAHHPPPPAHHGQQAATLHQAPPHTMPSHSHRDTWAASSASLPAPIPPPPQHWNSSDDSMRNWLQARAEEEKTRQEEEKTKQEGLRLEQRKIEIDMLRSSLSGGIPPPMIPLVFAGMATGGVLPQTTLDWAQQFMTSQSQYPPLPPPPPPPPRPHSQESQRETLSQAPGQYHPTHGPPPPPASGSSAFPAYRLSPTRTRSQTVSGIMGRPTTGPTIAAPGSGTPQSGTLQPSTSTFGPFPPQHSIGGHGSSQQDSNTSIYFHHWQPPVTPGSSSFNRPNSPSESQKKRKAGAEPPQHGRAGSSQRAKSPPLFLQSDVRGSSSRKTHKRHKSDVSWYQGTRQGVGPVHEQAQRAVTTTQDKSTAFKDRDAAEASSRQETTDAYARSRREDDRKGKDAKREHETGEMPK